MQPAAPVFAAQRGLIVRDQALGVGLTPRQIDHALAVGSWWAVHPGVYALSGVPSSRQLSLLATALWVDPRGGLSHLTAAEVLGVGPVVSRIHATVRLPSHLRSVGTVVVHRTRSMPDEHLAARDGLLVTTPERTLLDCAPLLTPSSLDAMVSNALRARLLDVESLAGFLDQFGKGRRGHSALKRSLARRSSSASRESELEDRTAALLRRHRIPDPIPQHEVNVDDERFRLDFAWPDRKVALECDGWAYHGDRESFVADRRRRSMLASAGWLVLVVTYHDVAHRPGWVIEQVVRALER